MWVQLLCALPVIYAIKKVLLFRELVRSIGNIPGYRTLLNAGIDGALIIPRIRGIIPGKGFIFRDKHAMYAWAGCDIIGNVSMFPSDRSIFVADPAAIKELSNNRVRFPKPLEMYDSLSIYGYNIVASEGDDWKRYRKICSPSFAERNNRLVCDETVFTVNDIFDNTWENKDRVVVDNFLETTLSIALSVISAAAFGYRMRQKDDTAIPSGHQMTFPKSLYTVARKVMYRLLIPDWAMPFTETTRQIDLGFKELKSYMLEFIEAKKSAGKHDLLSILLEANAGEGDKGLSASELMGNVFVFLIAGHESTANALCYALGLLALYPDEQEKLFKHIKSVVKDPRALTYDEIPLLTQTLAVLYEALRMYPPVMVVPKRAAEDTSLMVTNDRGERIAVPIPKDTRIFIDQPGLHYNPKYWEDPCSFKPDRFLQPNWNKDAFMPFSVGARACLGRRFSEIEAIVVITMIVAQYKITLTEEFLSTNESVEQKKERLLKTRNLLTLMPVKVPLVFTRRS